MYEAVTDGGSAQAAQTVTGLPATDQARTVGYVLKGYPRHSEPFIANEIHLLEEMGVRIALFSIKEGDPGEPHTVVSRIRAPAHYAPKVPPVSSVSLRSWLADNLGKFRHSHRAVFRRNPVRYLHTLGAALAMYWRYRGKPLGKPKKAIIKEFLQAGHIANAAQMHGGIAHLHGHFCHEATTVTWFVSRLTGVPFSFTAHAKDLYEDKLNPGDLLDRKLDAARFVATCTAANHEHFKSRFPNIAHVHTIYHGLDVDAFRPPSERPASDGPPLLVSVGRFVEKKGFAYLVEACALLKGRGIAFRCEIIGESGDELPRIRALIARHALGDVIQLQPPVPQERLREIYAAATLFTLPCHVTASGDRDGIPNVVAEAMAMGLPVVCSRVSGIPEIVEHGVNGWLVPQRDIESLADAIETVLSDPALQARLGEAAREVICACFDSAHTTQALERLMLEQLDTARVFA